MNKNQPPDILGTAQETSQTEEPIAATDSSFESALAGTTQAFTNRIQRKKQEKEQTNLLAEEAAKARHNTLLKSLLNIRRSLTDMTRIDLGERFCFSLEADDWGGWPRLRISLNDNVMRAAHYPMLQVSAHDRQEQAIVEIKYDTTLAPELISLADESNLTKMPLILKKCVRSYLDLIGELIIQAEQNSIEFSDSKNLFNQFATPQETNEPTVNKDDSFFAEDIHEVLESLPELDSIHNLLSDDEF